MSRRTRRKAIPEGREANRRVVMTHAQEGETFATFDPCDRAHSIRDVDGLLMPAGAVGPHATPRRYPRAYMHEVITHEVREEARAGAWSVRIIERAVAVVSDETVFDETFEAQRRLQAEGLDVFGRGRTGEAVREAMALHPRLRDLLRGGRR